MKLFKKTKRMNNRGFSLVEILCTVAILGIATTAVGGAMIVSAKNYSRNNVEMEVQQEAQIATNLIGELLVDAYNAESVGNVLSITGDGVNYEVSLDGTTGVLSYKEIRGANTVTGVLAKNVTKFEPMVPADFTKDKNVRINLEVTEGEKVYEATYNATARNGEVSNIPGVVETATLSVPSEIIVEPGQSIDIPVSLSGMSLSQVNGIKWEIAPSDMNNFVASKVPAVFGNGCTITTKPTAGESGSDYFNILVKTNRTESDGITPLAVTATTVKIRRANAVNVTITCLDPANHALMGTQYRIDAVVTGSYMDSTSEFFDQGQYQYKNPRFVDFKVSGENKWTIVDCVEKSDNPFMILELTDDLYSGEKITVSATAVHPEGIYDDGADDVFINETCNKASAQTDPDMDIEYGNVVQAKDIEGQGGGTPGGGGWAGPGTGGLRRGDYEFWTVPFSTEITDLFTALNASQYHRYWRFWSTDQPEPGPDEGWMYLHTTGDNQIQIQKNQSMMFDVMKEYWIELKLNICGNNRNDVKWPITDEEKEKSIYRFSLPASAITFKADDYAGYTNYSGYIGTDTVPIYAEAGPDLKIDVRTQRLNAKNLKDDFIFKVQKWNVAAQEYQDFGGMQVMREIDESDHDHIVLTLKSQANNDYKGQKFRIITSINYKQYQYNFSTEQYSEKPATEIPLYDEATGNGFIYVQFNN